MPVPPQDRTIAALGSRKYKGRRKEERSTKEEVRFLSAILEAAYEFHFLLRTSSFVLLGCLASITVPMPPRGRKSPLTTAHTGRAARTTSSSTRLTTFS